MLLFVSTPPLTVTRTGALTVDEHRPRARVTGAQRPNRARWVMGNGTGTTNGADTDDATGVLMVCLGNICRSPAAEAALRARAIARGLDTTVHVDSCGTGGGRRGWYMEGVSAYHEGDAPDSRMRAAAAARGLKVAGASRPLRAGDFARYKYMVAMDGSNVEAIEEAREHWGVERAPARVVLLSDFASDADARGRPIPDPYYGGGAGFENALDLIEDACDGLLDAIAAEDATRGAM